MRAQVVLFSLILYFRVFGFVSEFFSDDVFVVDLSLDCSNAVCGLSAFDVLSRLTGVGVLCLECFELGSELIDFSV